MWFPQVVVLIMAMQIGESFRSCFPKAISLNCLSRNTLNFELFAKKPTKQPASVEASSKVTRKITSKEKSPKRVTPPPADIQHLLTTLGDDAFNVSAFGPPEDTAIGFQSQQEQPVAASDSLNAEIQLESPTSHLFDGNHPTADALLRNLAHQQLSAEPSNEPLACRVQLTAVVTNSTTDCTALNVVHEVYDYIRNSIGEDKRIVYDIIVIVHKDDQPVEALKDSLQMWLDSYNTYHLIDGAAMKETWGAIIPQVILAKKNLDAIVAQVRWALFEDEQNGILLSPRMREIRLRGGDQLLKAGYNTMDTHSSFSVVNEMSTSTPEDGAIELTDEEIETMKKLVKQASEC